MKPTLLLIIATIFVSNSYAAPEGVVTIFHAGSLTVPFEIIEEMFEEMYPNVDIQRESGGSVACARKITDQNRECDIMASADYRVIDNMLIGDYTDWNCIFATNQMVLCYLPHSEFASELTSNNWYEILAKEGVEWGHSEPDADPCGYRTLLTLQLAEEFYSVPGLYNELIAGRNDENIRPRAVELISLLQEGELDYAFEYLSVAVQHDLEYLELPTEINLSTPDMAEFYSTASTEIAGNEPGSTKTVTGAPIAYGITILRDAPNAEAAEAFASFLLSPEGGLQVLTEMGQPAFIPVRVSPITTTSSIPAEIAALTE